MSPRFRSPWLFAISIFVSAFLVFQVQPIISKTILPWFGGSPAVWTTCMLFFQLVLFAGYAYAHGLHRLPPIGQAAIHLLLILFALWLLPISPDESWKTVNSNNPTWRIMQLLGLTVGLPYFLLSSTGPLLQSWFAKTNSSSSPYRLYALSNVGSLAALLTYPFLVEPNMTTSSQSAIWSAVFGVFAIGCAGCAWVMWRRVSRDNANDEHQRESQDSDRPTLGISLTWLALAAFASATLLATTNHVCQDIAVIPFLWVIPLSLYLVTFIICFDKEAWYVRQFFAAGIMVSATVICAFRQWLPDPGIWLEVSLYFSLMFFVCMTCHGELVRRKPSSSHLTLFYMMSSAGGALGGVFVAMICPAIFSGFFEMNLAILIGYVGAAVMLLRKGDGSFSVAKRIGFNLVGFLGLLLVIRVQVADLSSPRLEARRNFYGTLHLEEEGTDDPQRRGLYMYHGRIVHGFQFADSSRRHEATLYYAPASGAGITVRRFRATAGEDNQSIRVGVLGLGAGTMATYAEPGDYYRFYEINPDVCELAKTRFSFLADCKGETDVVLGDGRIAMEREEPQQFDVLVLDAFSGDAVPMHLLTEEAFMIYRKHMKPNGVIVTNISNKYVDLVPVFRRVADRFDYETRRFVAEMDVESFQASSQWFALSNNERFLNDSVVMAAATGLPEQYAQIPLWTDHYNNLFQVLK